MLYLGISEEHESGVCLVKDGNVEFAINEERITRKKFQDGWPDNSINQMLEYIRQNYPNDRVAGVGIGGRIHVGNLESFSQEGAVYNVIKMAGRYAPNLTIGNKHTIPLLGRLMWLAQTDRRKKLLSRINNVGSLRDVQVEFFDHHDCHAYSASYGSGWENAFIVTLDAAGDGYCSKVYTFEKGKLNCIDKVPFFHSIGYYYTLVTYLLGFKSGQQGKVTGLAARGDAEKTLEIFREFIAYNKETKRFQNKKYHYLDNFDLLKQKLANYSREDISAGIQKHLELSATKYINDIVNSTSPDEPVKLAVAGGVFANVLLNQKISQLDNVDEVFIFPNMGDGGLPAGAAFAISQSNESDYAPVRLSSVYLGKDYNQEDIEAELNKRNCEFTTYKSIESVIAQNIAENKVIARYEGRMEYGPRALGHRSILYNAKDPEVNQWLNQRLQRSEFMPFAPAVMEEMVDEYFDMNGQYFAAEFMTIVCLATDKCINECPAIVHIDKTARPQIVRKSVSPSFWNIINEYRKITGIGVLVNTSFNMHEEPIVESPADALNAFERANLDGLAVGDSLVLKV